MMDRRAKQQRPTEAQGVGLRRAANLSLSANPVSGTAKHAGGLRPILLFMVLCGRFPAG